MMMLQQTPDDLRYVTPERQAPAAIKVEQALLGAMLLNSHAIERAADILDPADFYEPLHIRIYEAMRKLLEQSRPVNPLTLAPAFADEVVSDGMTVVQYLGSLAAQATTIINVKHYAQIVRDYAVRRALIVAGEDLVNSAFDLAADIPATALIEETEQRLFGLAERRQSTGELTWKEASQAAIEAANSAYQRKGGLAGLSTGFIDLDQKLGGLAKSDLLILAGRPSMGKTALVTNIAWNIASSGFAVDFYSLEMSAEQLSMRILSSECGIAGEKFRRGRATEGEMRSLFEAQQKFDQAPLHIDQRGGLKMAQIISSARRKKRQFGTEIIIIDYLQLIGAQKAGGNRVQELTEITTGLKGLAKELNVPIIALSQLNRSLESRTDKRPQLSDLRESGSIEQDADVVMFVYRDEYYIERAKPDEEDYDGYSKWQAKMIAVKGKAEVIIGKQRHGPVGTIEMAFEGETTRFSDLAREVGEARYE